MHSAQACEATTPGSVADAVKKLEDALKVIEKQRPADLNRLLKHARRLDQVEEVDTRLRAELDANIPNMLAAHEAKLLGMINTSALLALDSKIKNV